ncbi:metallophosphoesterase family protein [Oceanibium sediminis]|uniref:metallophosphoesterase family protein n=1 Tax=Oceanibium sediminis TaxID=2026339 RepID=UPI000DD4CA69|nr:metallophosphoesterase family protein [Oceanibium sediminis]
MTDTDGKRIYAIGDIHGCLGALEHVLGRIAADFSARPHPAPVTLCVGDYVDRGPDARGVLDRLLALDGAVLLLGNHDELFRDFLLGDLPGEMFASWQRGAMGGRETLASYGLNPGVSPEEARAVAPASHLGFLQRAPRLVRIGGYVFVHAGIRPGVPLDRQDPHDLIWIREPFLSWTGPHPGIVVHGHTPVERVTHHGNRIEIDTGAVFGGPLSCLVLEGDTAMVLGSDGPRPLTPVGSPRGKAGR